MNAHTEIEYFADVMADLPLDEDLKLNIYRIVQEQIINIFKHASASEANVAIYPMGKSLFIEITDNGKGFDPLVKRKGVGITNMINRAELYNGAVHIDSRSGEGCRIEIRIPVCL